MKNKKGYLLCLFVLGIIATGCGNKTNTYDNYTIEGTVWWGSQKAIGDSVEMTCWKTEDTKRTEFTITDSLGKYNFKIILSSYYSHNMPLKVRAKDSTDMWSSFQYDTVGPNETATIDFHL